MQRCFCTCGFQENFGRVDKSGGLLGHRQRVPGRPSLYANGDEAALEKEAKVLADGGLRQTDVVDEVTDAMLSRGQMLQHRQSSRFTQSLKEVRVSPGPRSVKRPYRCPINRHTAILLRWGDLMRVYPDREITARINGLRPQSSFAVCIGCQ